MIPTAPLRPGDLTRRGAAAGLLLAAAPTGARAQPLEAWRAYAARLRRGAEDASIGWRPEAERALLAFTNAFRAKQGLPPLAPEAELAAVARGVAADILLRGFFDHLSPEGFSPSARVGLLARSLCGVPGENIARGTRRIEPTGRNLADFWWDSPEHRANMARPVYTHAGHGVAVRGTGFAAVAVFLQLQARLPAPAPLELPAAGLRPLLARAQPAVTRLALEPAAPGGAHEKGVEPLEGAPPAGLWRLRPFVPREGGGWLVTYGPVVALT